MSAFQDARSIAHGTVITTDVCVIGAGAAGITIARALSGSRVQVCLIESGGLELEAETQALAGGDRVGQAYVALESTRLRSFGGTTNHWAGWCAPLNALDFEYRDWVPASGWPITLAELTPYYERAQETNELAAFEYDTASWASPRFPSVELGGDIETAVWQFSPPTRYGQVYGDDLQRSTNVHVYLHANVTTLETTADARYVEGVELTTLEGTSIRVVARHFVLACGGIENARLLLLADNAEPGGLGNRHDVVGRYFMEHPHVSTASCVFADARKDLGFYTRRAPRRALESPALLSRIESRLRRELPFLPPVVSVRAGLRITDAAQRREGILNAVATLRETAPDDPLTTEIQRATSRSARASEERVSAFDVRLQLEQAPNPDSRVVLGEARDWLGQRVARLDWRLSELDERTMILATRTLARALGGSGEGRLRFEDWLLDAASTWRGMYGGNHHMGTTRMSDDPMRGVVDRDCRVHTVDNLFIAGSSVFPTGGFANPTLTLTALAHRLGDHLMRITTTGA